MTGFHDTLEAKLPSLLAPRDRVEGSFSTNDGTQPQYIDVGTEVSPNTFGYVAPSGQLITVRLKLRFLTLDELISKS